MTAKRERIIIPRAGITTGEAQPRAIYSGITQKVLSAVGQTETRRASHVEPGGSLSKEALDAIYPDYSEREEDKMNTELQIKPEFTSYWFADMTPVEPGLVLGPFAPEDRDKALAAEVKWLEDNGLPIPR